VLSALIYAEEDSKRETERRTARSDRGGTGGGRTGDQVRVVVESETT